MDSRLTSPTSVTFIIPHKGREEMLVDTLQSIAAQDAPDVSISVVVVSQNTSHQIPAELLAQLDISIHHIQPDWTISQARNFGVVNSESEFLAFLDADVRLAHNWLGTLLQELFTTNSKLISAQQTCPHNATMLEHIRTTLSNVVTHCYVEFLPGRNLLMRRDTFAQVGGFPEHLTTCEDYYFTHAVAQLGPLFYSASSHYIHLGEDKALSAMYKKEIWRGQSNIASLKGRKVPWREIPSFVVPPAMMLAGLTGVIGLLTGLYSMALVMFSAALLPLIAYSIRLYRHSPAHISLSAIVRFYATYFPARALGTVRGLFGQLHTDSHR